MLSPEPIAPRELSEVQLMESALEFHSGQHYGIARQLYTQILAQNPDHEVAWHNLGLVEHATGRHAQAAEYIGKAIDLKPDYARAYANLTAVLRSSRQFEAARDTAQRAIRLDPGFAPAHSNLGNVLEDMGQLEDALGAYLEACRLDPFFVEAHTNTAEILRKMGRANEALKVCKAIATKRPDAAGPHFAAGNILRGLLRLDEAIAEFRQATALHPDFAEAHCNLGNVLQHRGDLAGAIAAYEKALAVNPDMAEVHCNLGAAYETQRRIDDALKSYGRALALNPELIGVRTQRLHLRRAICEWADHDKEEAAVLALASDKAFEGIIPLFGLLSLNSGHPLQLTVARRWARSLRAKPCFTHRRPTAGERGRKLRIGYLSSDFFRHATAILMAGLFEAHDKSRFELVAYSHGADDRSELRHRLGKAFDQFVDLSNVDDRAAAQRIYDDKIDILIELKGYTQFARSEIAAHRPAPIQVNFVGYPGTMGADFIDYVIADPITLPMEQQAYYDEKIVHLPDTYQPNDRQRRIADRTPTRAECGLPDNGFVFCCFNNTYKLTPKFFDVWMRLVAAVPGSVLWLFDAHAHVKDNLRREAEARGVDPSRLVFAPRLMAAEHLARQRNADLFLDTLPYNAHTTTSDALWVGLPVVTLIGDTFAGRVAASLLHAVGLPELVTDTLATYEALALKLARDPDLLADIRSKLQNARLTAPAFDTMRYTRHLEAAYARMWDIWADGRPPEPFAVTPIEPERQATPTPTIARLPFAACPLCGSSAHRSFKAAAQVTWHVCEDCDHVFADGYCNPDAMPFEPRGISRMDAERNRAAVAPLISAVAKHIGPRDCDAAWLDVGDSDGALLLTAAEWGFEPVSLRRAQTADDLRALGVEIQASPLAEFDALGRFGVISFDDQLPADIDPAGAMAVAQRLLMPDGLLVLTMPNKDAPVFRVRDADGEMPYWCDTLRYHMFGRARLHALLRENGFEPIAYRISAHIPLGMDVIARRLG
jgi:protein O-GlcNAc transferase